MVTSWRPKTGKGRKLPSRGQTEELAKQKKNCFFVGCLSGIEMKRSLQLPH